MSGPAAATCPICGGQAFGPYNRRPLARCMGCGAVERTRKLWMVLQHLGLPRPGSRILHLAPERSLGARFHAASGELYHPCDLVPALYRSKAYRVFEMDACRDLARMPSACFDLVLHNHVLEHLPCAVPVVLDEFDRLVAPGGWHLLSVPFRNVPTTDEELGPLPAEERTRRFGQSDHLRIFGRDFDALLRARGFQAYRGPELFSPAALAAAAVPPPPAFADGATIFARQRPA
jgi:SAM-dependent methyltransferase